LIESRDCVEHGYLLLPAAEQDLAEGKIEAAQTSATSACEIGVRFNDVDLIACARHLQGRALVQQGQIREGLTLLDEAMLAVVAGELSPMMTGLVYCSVIDTCQHVYAVSRARDWTAAFARWCEQQPEMVAFSGACLVHRAELLKLSGAWHDALASVRLACERSERAARMPPAAAFYEQGEIHRLRGDFAAADDAYRRASRLGCEPQPGFSLLLAAQGRTSAARASIRRVVEATTDRFRRARLLPAAVEIALGTGDIEAAGDACAQLEQIARDVDTELLRAVSAQCRGAVELARGDAVAALGPLRRAFDAWQQLDSAYFAARVRVLLARACRSAGDEPSADLELAAARAVFRQLGALPDLASLDSESPHGQLGHSKLTARELQVLRLIAAGKTNRVIASELSLSERTIDRHVSNILTKLNVPSRAAAIAYAYDHKFF
jgi:DNA-binding CsgD family transcriptional regulator